MDPVLNYDPFSSTVHPLLAKTLMQFIEKYELNVSKIIDTHVHAVSFFLVYTNNKSLTPFFYYSRTIYLLLNT